MDIPILFEDEQLLVINKPAGLLVHPIPGGLGKTLIDWLRDRYPGFESLAWPDGARPGIVHRLDRDTSGVMIIAKTPSILEALQKQFAQRSVQKTYQALVWGIPQWSEKSMIAPISRGEGTKRRASYLKLDEASKPAETNFTALEQFEIPNPKHQIPNYGVTHMQAQPKTGRTHQIRVHLGLLEHPILGDPWYQTKPSRDLARGLGIERLMLHAAQLELEHPISGEQLTFSAPLANDFKTILLKLRTINGD